MKIFTMCMQCLHELGTPSFEPITAEYYEDRVSYITCSRGHKSALLLQSQKFEVLLASGANALFNGFTLEAAATFSAGLERFFEFALKVLCLHQGMPHDAYAAMFKQMARQSERQVGAFIAFYTLETGEAYIPNKKIIEFRNAIIHKGHIPTPHETAEFCSMVYDEIIHLYENIEKNAGDTIQKVVIADLLARSQQIPIDTPRVTTSGENFFCIAHKEKKRNFREAYEEFIKMLTSLETAKPELQQLHDELMRHRRP